MASTTINVEIENRTPELFQKLQSGIERFVKTGAEYVRGRLRVSMAEPKHGRRYGTHIASAPGESPAVDSSNLTGSIDIVQPNTLEAKVGTPVEYALYLEDGTGRMAARPLWERTAKESLPTLQTLLDAAVGRGQGGINILRAG